MDKFKIIEESRLNDTEMASIEGGDIFCPKDMRYNDTCTGNDNHITCPIKYIITCKLYRACGGYTGPAGESFIDLE